MRITNMIETTLHDAHVILFDSRDDDNWIINDDLFQSIIDDIEFNL